jgi:hypothetical protein
MAFNAQGVCAATPLSAHADQGKLFRAQHGDGSIRTARITAGSAASNAPTLLCGIEGMPVNQQNIAPMITGIAIEEFDSVYFGGALHFNPASLHVVRPRTNGLPRVSPRT